MDDHSEKKVSRFGSEALEKMVLRLKSTNDPRKRYEYVLWLAKKLPPMPMDLQTEEYLVKGCVSKVYVAAKFLEGRIKWTGESDALITRGLLALLIEGLNDLTPQQVCSIDPSFIKETGLHASLTPSRANGFLNILLNMKGQARQLALQASPITK